MKKVGFNVGQIVEALKQARWVSPVAEAIRKAGISELRLCRRKAMYAGTPNRDSYSSTPETLSPQPAPALAALLAAPPDSFYNPVEDTTAEPPPPPETNTQSIYDTEGNRVATGTVTSRSCDSTTS
jgi:hypothetical protein